MGVQKAALLFGLFVFSAAEDCMHCTGEEYRGKISITESGYTCQRWDSQTPHKHEFIPSAFPVKFLEENYCRNPDRLPRPWCYTTNPSKRWEFCSVPRCTTEPPTVVPELTCFTGEGRSYRGTISVTKSGITCQKWTSQTPHKHDRTPENYQCKGLEENYCRNPDNENAPWCYTTDPETRWEYCSVPCCGDQPQSELTCFTGEGSSYRGTISVTKSGKTCQKWTSQTPHTHDRTPDKYLCKGLEENYCRNPDNERAPWCYTTDPETRWEFCNVPSCGDQPQSGPNWTAEDCMHCTGDDYKGKISITESGYTCQRWDSQTPHKHEFVLSILPVKHLEENYCRNPDGQPRPWCYTTDPSKRWEYCSIPQCTTTPPTTVPEFTCITGEGRSYRGTISVTKSGKTCQKWTSQTPHKHSRTPENYLCKGLEENYCRNTDNERAPWCYTTDPETRWEYCNVPNCEDPSRPDCMHCNGEDYRGKISITENGYTCQRWDSQTPHKHDFVLSILPIKHLEENYCRNPDGSPRPWCYTTNPSKGWEYCSIPRCTTTPPTIVPELTCTTGDGGSYRGTISVTKSGKTCQKWTSQTPHNHDRTQQNYPCKGLDENYCRNPDNVQAPWCYTTDPETRWEYCNVPNCGDQPQSGLY
nr:apolipoprotein(a)-like isoform X2 [Misgurnus anguillicaudatus]